MKNNLRSRIGLVVFVCFGAWAAMAQQSATTSGGAAASNVVPSLINYSGVLKDAGGRTLTSLTGVTFLLYSAEQGGVPLWLETQNVTPDKSGHYTVQLGSTSAKGLPSDLFVSGEARWLAVQIGNEAERPRALLVAVPYAMKAADAQTLGGLPASAFVLAASPTSGAGSASAPSGAAASASATPPPVTSNVTTTGGTGGTISVFTTPTNIQNSILTQTGTTAINVGGRLNLPATGTATATAGFISRPQDFVASVFNGTAVVAQTFQWQAEPVNNNKATASGVMSLLYAAGTGAPGETGLKISSKGLFTFAAGQTFPGTGTITGVTTANGSGLAGGGASGTLNLSLIKTCATNQLLQWNGTLWGCSNAGTGTVTSVASGAGLTGGPITTSGTLSIASGGVSNAMLANPSLTVSAGTGLLGGGPVALGGSTTLNVDTTKIPQLAATNTFTGPLTVNESSATAAITGNQTAGGGGINYGVEGVTTSNNTGAAGVFGSASAGAANGVLGVTSSSGSGAAGVFGNATATSGSNMGVLGNTNSPAGFGVFSQGTLGVAGGSINIFGTADGNGTSLIPNQLLFQDNGEIASLDANHRIIFDRSNNILELREFGNILFSSGATSAQRTAAVGITNIGDLQVDFSGLNSGALTPGIRFGAGNSGEAISSQRTAGGNQNGLDFYTSFTPRLSIANAGNVSIGTTVNAGYQLDILGASGASGSNVSGTTGFFATGGNGDPSNPTFGGDAVLGFAGTGPGGDGIGGFFAGGDFAKNGDSVLADQGSGFAGNFRGSINVQGAVIATTKDFKIDHPLDPANKYLVHASVESAEMMNIYTGNVTSDAQGVATVQLPEWFEALNTDFRYQLTVIGQFAQAIVAREIQNHRFEIRTSLPNVKVSWQVTGVRQDAYARAHPLVVEEEKDARLRGFYIHPDLFGAPEERQIEWARHPEQMKRLRELRQGRLNGVAHEQARSRPVPVAEQRSESAVRPAAPTVMAPPLAMSKLKLAPVVPPTLAPVTKPVVTKPTTAAPAPKAGGEVSR